MPWLDPVHLLIYLFILTQRASHLIPIYKFILTFMRVSSHCGAQGSQNSTSYEFSPSLSFWNLTICHSTRFIGHLKGSRNWTVAFSGSLLPWVRASVLPPSSLRSWKCHNMTLSMINFGWVKSLILFAFMPMTLLREINNSRTTMATSGGL